MSVSKIFVFGIFFIFNFTPSCSIEELTHDEFKGILKTVANEDQYSFLRQHILVGYMIFKQLSLETEPTFQNLGTDEKLSLSIFKYLRNHKFWKNQNNVVCIPGIGCIDLDDPAVHPN